MADFERFRFGTRAALPDWGGQKVEATTIEGVASGLEYAEDVTVRKVIWTP